MLACCAHILGLTEMQDDQMGYSSRVLSSCSGTTIAHDYKTADSHFGDIRLSSMITSSLTA
jgi:hypothetical protein